MNHELILQHFPGLTPKQQEQFAALGPLYETWNAQINVVSRKDIEQLYERHVLHSLGIAKVYTFDAGEEVMDLGTGGGFPGIPLAILFPGAKFHLVDSIGKKIKVVNEVAAALGLQNVTAQQARAEELKNAYDTVVTRAVAPLSDLVRWTRNNLEHGGKLLALKGGDLIEELTGFEKRVRVYGLADYFPGEFFETKKVVAYAAR